MNAEVDVESRARSMGWLPKEEFRGNPEVWKPAEEYVRRGDEFIPFLQADRKKLTGDLEVTKGELAALKRQLAEASETIETLKEFRTELTKERVEVQRDRLVAGIAEARERGDISAEEALRDKLAEARKALETVPTARSTAKLADPPVDVTKLPEWQEFLATNPWWNEDAVMRAGAVAIGQDLAAKGALDGLDHRQRFAKIAEATRKRFAVEEPRITSKVEGGRGGAGTETSSTAPKGRSYNDLPPDAKDGAARFESRLVGTKAGQFKTIEAYRKHYADEYFKRNS